VLRRIFGPRRDELTGDWRKLHNEELHDLYSSPSIIGIIKSRRASLQESLGLKPLITLIILFRVLQICILKELP
jgi:hypothetical protein